MGGAKATPSTNNKKAAAQAVANQKPEPQATPKSKRNSGSSPQGAGPVNSGGASIASTAVTNDSKTTAAASEKRPMRTRSTKASTASAGML